MKDFTLWFLSQLPSFLLAEPISAFTGLAVLSFVVSLTQRIMFGRVYGKGV
uniref:Uncharacterized protein n=1 Tax=uncultured prokaryote TaxID=198431 RepID=A0A0H5QFM1_9ZZZZ|nr:hypothetical protein [uncultured prokaryote]